MAASKITYSDKIGVVPKGTHINQVWDEDMNEIKDKFNTNADLIDTNTTNIATNTANISTIQGDRAFKHNVVTKTGDYTAVINDFVLVSASSADITITLPTATGVIGQEINVCKIDATTYDIIINTTSSQLIIGSLTQTLSKQWSNVTLVSAGTYWIVK